MIISDLLYPATINNKAPHRVQLYVKICGPMVMFLEHDYVGFSKHVTLFKVYFTIRVRQGKNTSWLVCFGPDVDIVICSCKSSFYIELISSCFSISLHAVLL